MLLCHTLQSVFSNSYYSSEFKRSFNFPVCYLPCPTENLLLHGKILRFHLALYVVTLEVILFTTISGKIPFISIIASPVTGLRN